MSVPNPLNVWKDAPGESRVSRLTPYKTTAGYWVWVDRGSEPAGATQGAMLQTTYGTLVTSTTAGRRITRAPSAAVLTY